MESAGRGPPHYIRLCWVYGYPDYEDQHLAPKKHGEKGTGLSEFAFQLITYKPEGEKTNDGAQCSPPPTARIDRDRSSEGGPTNVSPRASSFGALAM